MTGFAADNRQESLRNLPKRASVVIVGGGIQGLSCAYNLAALGLRDVLVLDKGYWQSGASGRNGTLIRGGFFSPEWTRLFSFSNREWITLSQRLRRNVMFSRRGYAMVAETEATAAGFERALAVHRECGINSYLVTGRALRQLVPAIDSRTITSVLHQPDGGVAPHHAAMKAYLSACTELDVRVHYHTLVTGFDRAAGKMNGVYVGDHRIEADRVVIAAGANNSEMAELAGVTLAGYGMRIEAMALEPLRPLIRPALALIDRLCYMHQTARGEIVGGTEIPERPRMSLQTDFPVLATHAKACLELLPQLAELRVLRHWAGMLHISPDFGPMIGAHPAVGNLWFTAGWSYGIAGAPGAGALLARAIATGDIDERIRPFAVDRFDRGCPVAEAGIVLAKYE